MDQGRERHFGEGVPIFGDPCGIESGAREGHGVTGFYLSSGCRWSVYDESGEGRTSAGESAASEERKSKGDHY
jgi:hypothetical protein